MTRSSNRAAIPSADIETLPEGEDLIELAATLVPTAADPQDLDAVTHHLERHEIIESATWTVSTES
jgi:putative Mg2+ transporter-C (MgtC) family protein